MKIFDELEFKRVKETFFKIFGFNDNKGIDQELVQGNLFSGNDLVQDKSNLIRSNSYYQRIDSNKELEYLMKKLLIQKVVAFDTETESLNSLDTEIVGISFSWIENKGFYVPIANNKSLQKEYFDILRPFFENDQIIKVGHNLKFDIKVLFKYDISVSGPLYDTMVAHYLINPDMRHNLDTLSESYLNYSPISIETLVGKKGKNQGSMRDVPVEEVTDYASEDADLALQLKKIFDKELNDNGVKDIFNDIEIPIINVLADMEKEGISIDSSYLSKLEKEFEVELSKLKKAFLKCLAKSLTLILLNNLGIYSLKS
jgi:DNA polymerase-1